MTFNKILEKYRATSLSERDKGDKFERLMQAYLFTDPKYKTVTEKVWLWSEFPYRSDFGSHDVGIDLVVKTIDGDYWAVQCKCYQEKAKIDKPEVDTFLSTSGRKFTDENSNELFFSQRLWISTTNNWTAKAEETLRNQTPPVTRENLTDLQESPVLWEKLEEGVTGEQARKEQKELRSHQKNAVDKTISYFNENSRGKLIMACGTGKTFTSLKIAEEVAGNEGIVLFLVPSIALLGQTLREWTADSKLEINPICICSDKEIAKQKKKNEDIETYSVVDLALPASTNVDEVLKQFENFEMKNKDGLTVVFSTYQSIDVISQAQKRLEAIGSKFDKFSIIICDEAHRTTGVTLAGNDESAFVKVHDNKFINAKKRLYMTATPRLYAEESKKKAEQSSAVVCSMDDEALYGKEIYRIGFGEAVERDLLSDYKVLILTLSENDVTPEVQRAIQNSEQEISTDDLSKLIGCINAMSKQIISEEGTVNTNDPEPMRRAVAFTPNIRTSKKITDTFNEIRDAYGNSVPELKKENLINLHSRHIDGSMSATERDGLMTWLKDESSEGNEARVLTNVRCLSEGVDVPSLDAVMFLSAKNSQVDVVQSVGRVMRRSPGKKYGYIIIPIVVPSDVTPEEALNDNERYKVVWTVLNALRAHDDRFNATVNKIELNKNKPDQILVGRVDPDGDGDPFNDTQESKKGLNQVTQLAARFDDLQNAIYAKMVQKVGEREYWENWAKSVADIAQRQITRITKIVDEDDDAHMAFRHFLKGLQKNINPSITELQAIEMLSQHIITKPVFEALFEGYSFVQNNAVSISLQKALDAVEAKSIEDADTELLSSFYDSVRRRAIGIDNAEGKQRVIIELYDKFFKTAFPKMVEQLGIVYTPIEVVDFIIHSVDDVLKKEFGRSLTDEGVNILDPFTGTGTFITRLLQSGVIKPQDLERKYKHEIFANEIVLLAYYIAAVNIENTYHDLLKKDEYDSFEGIVLTDTFQLYENDDTQKLFSDALAGNSKRLQRQKSSPLKVILGNPPYSVGQKSANDDAQNTYYAQLDRKIDETYAKLSNANLKKSLHDSYIKAFRLATDHLLVGGGVVGFVTNGSWLEGNAQDGMRKSLEKEFTSIYVFNLRGNQRTSGELSRKEGGKIFGSGSRTPISITLLVKNTDVQTEKATIHYHDIGDYLNREEKLKIIRDFKSFNNPNMPLKTLHPNEHGDWLNFRNSQFAKYIMIGDKKTKKLDSYFNRVYSAGIKTNRDAWCYNFSAKNLKKNMSNTIKYYNSEIDKLKNSTNSKLNLTVPQKISWSGDLINAALRGVRVEYSSESVKNALYRPFTKTRLYFDKTFNNSVYNMPSLFPEGESNLVICTSGVGSSKEFSTIITDQIPDIQLLANDQCFPLFYYEKNSSEQKGFFDSDYDQKYIRRDSLNDFLLERAERLYGKGVSKKDIFYYVYGFLHSKEYREAFANDLKKMLPRLPLVDSPEDFWAFSEAGRKLADLHVNYEDVDPYEGVKVSGTQHNNYHVEKLKFVKKEDRSTIIYNDQIKIENIPEKAYEYVVNGKSPIEWIIDRYQIKTDKASGIVNDPNDWAKEVGNPRYILDLILSIINVSVQTVDIVNNLPKIDFTEESTGK